MGWDRRIAIPASRRALSQTQLDSWEDSLDTSTTVAFTATCTRHQSEVQSALITHSDAPLTGLYTGAAVSPQWLGKCAAIH